MGKAMSIETRVRLDDIIRRTLACLHDASSYWYDPDVDMIESLAVIVQRECQEAGLRVSRRDVLDRVSDFAVGAVEPQAQPFIN